MRFPPLTACLLAAASLATIAGAAFAQDAAPAPQAPQAPPVPPPAAAAPAPTTKPLAGGVMSSDKTLAENIAGARDLADFTGAVNASDQKATLSAAGPFTVFAANRGAFDRLDNGVRSGWMKPEGKRRLTAVVTYNIVPEMLTEAVLAERIKAGNGEAYLATVEGGNLTIRSAGRSFVITDVNGNKGRILGGAPQANGMLYVVDAVLQP